MMKTKIVLLLIFVGLLIPNTLWTKKLAEFEDIFQDPFVLMDESHICIWSRIYRKIYVYKRSNFKKIAAFGRRGRGPGEFIAISSVSLKDKKLYVSNFPKLSVFSLKGELLDEVTGSNHGSLVPFEKGFIGISYPFKPRKAPYVKTAFTLYDSNLEQIKTIFEATSRRAPQTDNRKATILIFADCTKMNIFDNGLVIGATDSGFYFAVFDLKGNLKHEIKREFPKRPVTDIEKQRFQVLNRKNMGEREWKRCQMIFNYVFPKHYPAYEGFSVDNNRIYVFAYPKNNLREVQILDLKGKLIKRCSMPAINAIGCIKHGRYAIRDSIFYYVDENEETENWELHAIPIE